MISYDILIKKFLNAYDLLLFPEKKLNLILGVVHNSHAGPISAKPILKTFTFFFRTTTQHYNSKEDINSILMQWKPA